ncbi:MAG: 3-phosphoserine/phosphohydroxythreonine transaminase, partial [Deltaproteobacteria bacterium]|nr:3-phosphoserine/phosphohydroxythreonine transaminase [Deltaproteobacteria bacterium]
MARLSGDGRVHHRDQPPGERGVAVLNEAQALFRELTGVPDNFRILFVHGGARMQFSALPLNFAGRVGSRKCLYVE